MSSDGIPLEVKVDVHVLAEAAGVVITSGLCVTESFKEGVGLDQDVLHPGDALKHSNCFGKWVIP